PMSKVRLGRYEIEHGLLPPLCMRCGAPATTTKRKTFSWSPSWIYVLILFGLLPFVIVALILTRRMRIEAPLCAAHQKHWSGRALFLVLGLVGFCAMGLTAMALLPDKPRGAESGLSGLLCIGTLFGGSLWLIAAAVLQATAIHPTEITERSITLV